MSDRGALWGAAVTVAAIGTSILWAASPGLNWGVWTVTASAGGILCARVAGARLGARAGLAALACALAVGAAITTDAVFQGLILLGVLWLFAMTTSVAEDPRAERIGLPLAMVAPLVAMGLGIAEAARRTGELSALAGARRHRPIVRGSILALVVVGVFAAILAGADPILAALRYEVIQILERLDFIPRLGFFVALLVATLGSYGLALRPGPIAATPPPPAPVPRWTDLERIIVLGAVTLLFAVFLGLQVSYLFGNAPALAGSGITFAEYARRGFAELTVVASLCTLLILGLEGRASRGPREPAVRAVALTLIALLGILLVSACRRLWLYEDAYGFTTARLYAQVYMAVVAFALLMLTVELISGLDTRRLLRRTAVLGVVSVVLLNVWNHESWIAEKNLKRAAQGGPLDMRYLVWNLSLNAVPALVASADRPPFGATLNEALRARYAPRTAVSSCRWFDWNLRQRQAAEALRAAGIIVADASSPSASSWCVRVVARRRD